MRSPTVQSGKRAAYPQYKSSGVAWLGDVPEHWNVKCAKSLLVRNDSGVWGEDFDDSGIIVLRSTEQTVDGKWNIVDPARRLLSVTEYKACRLQEGDLVVTKSSGSPLHIGKTSIVTKEIEALDCCHSNFMQRLRVRGNTMPRFVWYMLNGELGRQQFDYYSSTTTGLANLNGSIIGNVAIAFPPLDEQHAIASFLDRETARIDALIEKKQRQIELLQEKRSALISHAVTKGLDPDAKMKDSGIEGMGGMPIHWSLKRLKFLTPQVTVGIVITPSKYYEDTGVPCLRSLNVRSDELTENDLVFISAESNELLRKSKLRMGDVVVVRTGKPGTAAVVDKRFDGANCIDLIIIRKCGRFDSRFICYVLNSEFSLAQCAAGTSGAIQGHFNIETASNMLIPVPPVEEQIRIRERLDLEIGKLKLLGRKVEESITMLREYRTALISAAVTGKIDIRKEVP